VPHYRGLLPALLLAAALPLRGVLASTDPGNPAAGLPSVRPVEAVDLARYAGGWYEIARIPNRFQRQCARHTIAHYGLRPDGRLSVLNQCIKRSGNVDQATGVATVVDPVSRARLKVSLVSLLGWRPFWGDYWVIGLDAAYRWAVVGSPDRRYGWVLARTPRLDDASMANIREILQRNGYDWARFALSDTRR
jgi:apolipoprotein D and lipocalin family protein